MVSDKVRAGPSPAELRAQAQEDLMWLRCDACGGQERRLDRPSTEPGARWMPHARLVDVPDHRANELPQYREQCPNSLRPVTVSAPVGPPFAAADTGGGT